MILFEISSTAKKAILGGLAGGALGAGLYTLGKVGSLYSSYKQAKELGQDTSTEGLINLVKFLRDNPEYSDFALKNLKYTASDDIDSVKNALIKAAEKMGEKAEEAKEIAQALVSLVASKAVDARDALISLFSKTEDNDDKGILKHILKYVTDTDSRGIKTAGLAGAGLGAAAGGIYALAKKAKQRKRR